MYACTYVHTYRTVGNFCRCWLTVQNENTIMPNSQMLGQMRNLRKYCPTKFPTIRYLWSYVSKCYQYVSVRIIMCICTYICMHTYVCYIMHGGVSVGRSHDQSGGLPHGLHPEQTTFGRATIRGEPRSPDPPYH